MKAEQNHVSPLWCFKMSASVDVFFRKETGKLHSLKFKQNILLTDKKNHGSLKEITLSGSSKEKSNITRSLQRRKRGYTI